MKRLILVAVMAGFLGACAEETTKTAQEKDWVDRTYRTGTNIPTKHTQGDGVATVSKDDMDRIRNGSSGATPSMPAPPPGGAH